MNIKITKTKIGNVEFYNFTHEGKNIYKICRDTIYYEPSPEADLRIEFIALNEKDHIYYRHLTTSNEYIRTHFMFDISNTKSLDEIKKIEIQVNDAVEYFWDQSTISTVKINRTTLNKISKSASLLSTGKLQLLRKIKKYYVLNAFAKYIINDKEKNNLDEEIAKILSISHINKVYNGNLRTYFRNNVNDDALSKDLALDLTIGSSIQYFNRLQR